MTRSTDTHAASNTLSGNVAAPRREPLGSKSTAVPEPPYPSPPYAWFVVICLQLAYAVALLDRQILALLVQPVRADLQLTDTQFSLLVGFAFVLFYSTMGLFCGRLADIQNRKNMIIVGMVLWCLATAACGLASNFQELFAARMLVGVGEAVLSPAAYSMIADYFPKEQRARAASVYSMAIPLGSGAALLFGGAAVAATAHAESVILPVLGAVRGWQAAFIFVGLPGLLVAALMLFVREPARRDFSGTKSTLREAGAFLRSRAKILSLIILAFALNGLVTYCLATWTPAMFIRNFGWSAGAVAAAQGTILITAGSAGVLAGGWWVSRKGVEACNSVVLTASRNALLCMPLLALLAGFAPLPSLRLIGLAGLAFFGGFPSAHAAVAIYHATPNQFRGQVTSIYIMSGTLVGLGIGVTLVAMITDYVFQNDQSVGKSMGLVVAAAALLASYLLHLALQRPDKDLTQEGS